MDETQRKKLEALNTDHHKRMGTMHCSVSPARTVQIEAESIRSRALLVHAMLGCRNRVRPEWPTPPFLLEIGAGYAGDRDYLIEQLGCEYSGVEVVEQAAVVGRDKGVLYMAFEDAPGEWERKFHYLYSRHVMEHTVNLELTLSTLKRVLAPHGVVGAVTPNDPDDEPAHVTQQTLEQWCGHYRRHGLRPVYAKLEQTVCNEAHIVCVHEEFALTVFGPG